MDDQLNDDTTCGSIDSTSRGMHITPRVSLEEKPLDNKHEFVLFF